MPHLVLCAASAPLHELPLCEMDSHHAHHDKTVHSHDRIHRKCSKAAVQDHRGSAPSRVVHMFRAAYDGFMHPHTIHAPGPIQVHRSSASMSELRPDLVAIPRVGFPPNQTNSNLSYYQPIGIQCNVAAPVNVANQIYTPMPNMVIPAQNVIVHQGPVSPVHSHMQGGSQAYVFTRIEAIYI